MRRSVGIRQLQQNARSILKRVSNGEVINVTKRGHPIARLVPCVPGGLDQLVSEGRASDAEGDLLELMDELNLPGPAERGKRRPTTALAEMRTDAPR